MSAPRLALAQQGNNATAPVPPQILRAKTVFVSNAGGDPTFTTVSGGVNRAYEQFYADLQRWPRFTLVSTPQQADLIIEIRSLANASTAGGPDPAVTYAPELQLRLLDPSTRTTLWTLDSWLHGTALREQGRSQIVDRAAAVLVLQLQQLVGQPLTPAQARAAARRPGPSRRSTLIWIAVAVAAAVIPTAILLSRRHSVPNLPQPAVR